jgi:neural Wiskott-Aldrich syndrome protein
VETAYGNEVELGFSEIVLFSSSHSDPDPLPSTYPFAIPLTPDTPQSMRTSQSSLSHILTATIHPSDPLLRPLFKSLTVHTRRYTSHTHTIAISPETHSSDDPTLVKVEIPRAIFRVGELIPLYVTIPPPRTELVLGQGLRLRNVRAELVRVVKVKREVGQDDLSDADADLLSDNEGLLAEPHMNGDGPSNSTQLPHHLRSSSKAPISPLFMGSSYRTIMARSGASCRFHSEKPVQLRFILHQPPPSGSPSDDHQVESAAGEFGHSDNVTECASISQTTVLHSVSFRLNVYVSFVNTTSRTERFSTISIPILIIAPPAPLPEVEESMAADYQKKHDRPPAKTVRYDDESSSAPRYDGEAGPSVLSSGAPPPFEERDAPPPFSSSEREASTSTHLPTFLESEREIIIPEPEDQSSIAISRTSDFIPDEGVHFGFVASEQFDGHSDVMQRSASPVIVMTTNDSNLADLMNNGEPEIVMDVLGRALALDQHVEAVEEQMPPPPPPAMDDPSDPPPSIDSDFRSPAIHLQPLLTPGAAYNQPVESTGLHAPAAEPIVEPVQSPHNQAPPPYLVPDNDRDQGHVTRPPPYMDLMPSEG